MRAGIAADASQRKSPTAMNTGNDRDVRLLRPRICPAPLDRSSQANPASLDIGCTGAYPQKLKTTGRALPVVLEVYHKGRDRLLETKLPPNDLIGYLPKTIHN
jgi:hypothetical protein